MARRASSSESGSHKGSQNERINNIRTNPVHTFDNLTRKLLQLGVFLSITTFVGLIVRYLVQEFDPNVGQLVSVTTSRVGNRDFASLSVSRNFLERILEFIEESLSILATIIPLGFPLCTIFNRYFAKIRAGSNKIIIENDRVLSMIPKYIIIGDSLACQMPNSTRLRPLVRDTIYHLIKANLKPKLIVEDSYEDARKLGVRIGLLRRDHHKLAVIKSVDLLKSITDSRGDIKQAKVRYLLSRLKILSQSTPADKSFLIYLIKHCETMPNENLVYLGYSFTDPEAMRLADCSITFNDCDDEDVKKEAQVKFKSENLTFTDLYLFIITSLLYSNIIQSYALYQVSAAVSSSLYRFLSITVFQEQLMSHSQFMLLIMIHQLFAIIALMTKWLSSLPKMPIGSSKVAEMSHAVTEDSILAASSSTNIHRQRRNHDRKNRNNRSRSTATLANGKDSSESQSASRHRPRSGSSARARSSSDLNATYGVGGHLDDEETGAELNSFNRSSERDENEDDDEDDEDEDEEEYDDDDEEEGYNDGYTDAHQQTKSGRAHHRGRRSRVSRQSTSKHQQPIHLSGIDLDHSIINSGLVTSYKQTFHNSSLVDDVTYRLAKLHIAYQILVMIIIMIFGNSMFQLDVNNNRQHQTLALNSLIMNNVFNLANCFNQFGAFNIRSGLKDHPFFLCVLILAIFVQVSLTELNAFGLENMNPIQWFVCFVFAILSALIAPLTGQQQRHHSSKNSGSHELSSSATSSTYKRNISRQSSVARPYR